MFWGFSEAIDLCNEQFCKHINENSEEINILLFGNSDPRNILQTIAKSYKHKIKVNFFILDGVIEIVARNMLLLALALESSEEIALRTKTHFFMDIYGNSLLRPASYNYLTSKGEFLKKLISDPEKLEKFAPLFNIDNLKYRERDGLIDAINFWQRRRGIFNMPIYWEERLRKTLGARFDHRDGVFDWDLQIKLKDNGMTQVCPQEYKHWRNTGIAFAFPEYEQSQPNKTLIAGLILNGDNYSHRGYVGDMEVGPFCAFGLKTSEEKMKNSFHGINDYRATDITERNLFEIFYEIEMKCIYDASNHEQCHKFGGVQLALGKHVPNDFSENIHLKSFENCFIPTPNFKIFFLSPDDIISIQKGIKYPNKFDVVFVGSNYFQFVEKQFGKILKKGSIILFETKIYSLHKEDYINQFLNEIKKFATEANLKMLTNYNINLKYSVIKLKCDKD